jgi:hypothetical protein
MDFAATAVIRWWFSEIMELVRSVPTHLRMNAGEVMLTITLSSKWVIWLGRQMFGRKTNKLPHFPVMASFSAEGAGPPPMVVVPNLTRAKQVFADFQGRCVIASTDNGWVDGKARGSSGLPLYRERLEMPDQPAVLFVDGAPTRGNVVALGTFRAHRVYLITFLPHLTHVLQPMEVSWVRAFKAEFVKRFRAWGSAELAHRCASYSTPPEVYRL